MFHKLDLFLYQLVLPSRFLHLWSASYSTSKCPDLICNQFGIICNDLICMHAGNFDCCDEFYQFL